MHISAHTYNFIKIKANLLLLAFQNLESSLGFLSEKLQPEFYFNNFLDNVFINVYPHFQLLLPNHLVQYGVEIIRSMSRYILGMEFKQKMIEIIERNCFDSKVLTPLCHQIRLLLRVWTEAKKQNDKSKQTY